MKKTVKKPTKKSKVKHIASNIIKPKSGEITVTYSSNNSGGHWWLEDEHWFKLEKAGWKVEWNKDIKDSLFNSKDGRFLGALATRATLACDTPAEAIASWEAATDQDPWAEGCNCCGNPHNFSYKDENGHTHYARIETTSHFAGWC